MLPSARASSTRSARTTAGACSATGRRAPSIRRAAASPTAARSPLARDRRSSSSWTEPRCCRGWSRDVGEAESHVHIAGWYFTPEFRMGFDGPTLRDLLAEAASRVDVRVLAWAGAPLPLFHPDRRRGARDARRADARDEDPDAARRARAADALPSREARDGRRPRRVCRRNRSHLVKAGDRLDSSAHPPRSGVGWHDAAFRLEGPDRRRRRRALSPALAGIACDAARACAGRRARGPARADRAELGLRRVAARGSSRSSRATCARYALPSGSIYLESQFLWSPELIEILAAKLREPPHRGLSPRCRAACAAEQR